MKLDEFTVDINKILGHVELRSYMEYTGGNRVVGMSYSIHYNKDNQITSITTPEPTGVVLIIGND